MDLRLLEYFVAVIDEGGVTKAATSLYIAQPSLSQAIRGLERELGVELFHRSGRTLTLTTAGETFEIGARKALRDADRARARVAAVRDLRGGRLRISAISNLVLEPLPQAAAMMQQRHPRIQLHITDPGGSVGVVNQVRLGRAELGLCHLDVATDPLVPIPIGEERLGLVMAPHFAATLPDPVPLDQIGEVPLLMDRSDQLTQSLIEGAVKASGAAVAVRCQDRQALWELVRAGVGATFLPDSMTGRIRDVRWLRTDPPLVRPVGVVHRKATLSPAAGAFLAILRNPALPPAPRPA